MLPILLAQLAIATAFIGSIASSTNAAAAEATLSCTTAKEFIVTHRYLMDHKEFGTSNTEAQAIAQKVAKGCSGAALRFTRVMELLIHSELTSKNALQTALEFAPKSEEETSTFLHLFKFAFLTEGMDLDVQSALAFSKSLTTSFNGDSRLVREDFFRITDYCSRNRDVDLSRTDCGRLAARIVKLGEKFGGGISEAFVRILEFLKDDSRGPKLTVRDALQEAEALSQGGPNSAENFLGSYRYGVSEKGLALTPKDAIRFAHEITLTLAQK